MIAGSMHDLRPRSLFPGLPIGLLLALWLLTSTGLSIGAAVVAAVLGVVVLLCWALLIAGLYFALPPTPLSEHSILGQVMVRVYGFVGGFAVMVLGAWVGALVALDLDRPDRSSDDIGSTMTSFGSSSLEIASSLVVVLCCLVVPVQLVRIKRAGRDAATLRMVQAVGGTRVAPWLAASLINILHPASAYLLSAAGPVCGLLVVPRVWSWLV